MTIKSATTPATDLRSAARGSVRLRNERSICTWIIHATAISTADHRRERPPPVRACFLCAGCSEYLETAACGYTIRRNPTHARSSVRADGLGIIATGKASRPTKIVHLSVASEVVCPYDTRPGRSQEPIRLGIAAVACGRCGRTALQCNRARRTRPDLRAPQNRHSRTYKSTCRNQKISSLHAIAPKRHCGGCISAGEKPWPSACANLSLFTVPLQLSPQADIQLRTTANCVTELVS